MPCQECAGMRVELLSLKEFMAQWFNILIQKIETVEQQNSRLSQMRDHRDSSQSLQSSSSSNDEKLNSSSFHGCSDKSTRPPSSSSGQSSTGSRSTVAPIYPGFRFNAADLGFTRRDRTSSFVNSPTAVNCAQKSDSSEENGCSMSLDRDGSVVDNDGYSSTDFTCMPDGGSRAAAEMAMEEGNRSPISLPSSATHRSSKHEMPRTQELEAKNLCTLNSSTGRFVCRLCQSSFTQFSNLRRHIRVIHQGLTKHACRYCDKVFAWKGAWRRHEQFVHELRRGSSNTQSTSMVRAE